MGDALNYLEVRMRSGVEGFLPSTAFESDGKGPATVANYSGPDGEPS